MAKVSKRNKILLAIYAMSVAALWFLFYAIYSLVIVCTLFFSTIKIPTDYTVEISLKGTNKEKPISYEISESEIYINDDWYVNFSEIADVCSFPVSGDPYVLRYKIQNADGGVDYMLLDIEKGQIQLNSNAVCEKIVIKSDSVFLPARFIDEYVNGIDIEIDTEDNVLKITMTGEYSLKLKQMQAYEKIDISEL